MRTFSVFAFTVIASLVLAGCSTPSNKATQEQSPSTLEQSNEGPAALPTSNGDMDEDFEDIETSLDSINPDTDFPSVSESELSE